MHAKLSRRQFLMASSAAAPLLVGSGCQGLTAGRTGRTGQADRTPTSARFFFTSQGKTALMNADGAGLRYFEFKQPNQASWQPGPIFPDGRRVIFLSMEPRRDGPGRPFEEYYTQTPTHLWLYDLEKDSLTEIATRQRLAVFYTPALLINDRRMLVQVVRNKVGQIFSM